MVGASSVEVEDAVQELQREEEHSCKEQDMDHEEQDDHSGKSRPWAQEPLCRLLGALC